MLRRRRGQVRLWEVLFDLGTLFDVVFIGMDRLFMLPEVIQPGEVL